MITFGLKIFRMEETQSGVPSWRLTVFPTFIAEKST
jgi:hypothetical protein